MRYKILLLFLSIQLLILLLAVFFKPDATNYTVVMNSYQFTNTAAEPIEQKGSDSKNCGLFDLPQIDAEPVLPIEEIKKLNPKDTKKLDEVIMNHTSELTKYIKDYKKKILSAYEDYILSCR